MQKEVTVWAAMAAEAETAELRIAAIPAEMQAMAETVAMAVSQEAAERREHPEHKVMVKNPVIRVLMAQEVKLSN